MKVTGCTTLFFPANAGRSTVKVSSKGGYVGGVVGYAQNSKVINSKLNGVKINGEYAGGAVGKAVDSEIENISVDDTSVTGEKYAGGIAGISINSSIKGTKVGGT